MTQNGKADSAPMVSVVIPTCNNAKFLPEALDSLLSQTFRSLELIVVDDGSTDDTADVLKPYEGRVRYIKKPNGGPASARNAGIKHARGELIAFQDADDIWLPEKLQLQVDYLREHPEAGVVVSACYSLTEDLPGRGAGSYEKGSKGQESKSQSSPKPRSGRVNI